VPSLNFTTKVGGVILSINRKALSRHTNTRDCLKQFEPAMGLETVGIARVLCESPWVEG
jgi:hypothetical protein